jgi:hypothetical protein
LYLLAEERQKEKPATFEHGEARGLAGVMVDKY